jgi:seryl-tRNA synthetase
VTNATGDQEFNEWSDSPPASLLRKKNLSTWDLDPIERKKQAALAKVEAKLEKAQRLHHKAHQSVEQEISDFLRVTSIPNTNQENNSVRTANATFDKRIRTLQDTKKEIEKKIATYQSDISRIQAGDIPANYASSKDIFSNIKSTAVKVAGGSLKYRSTTANDPTIPISTGTMNELPISINSIELEHYPHSHSNLNTSLSTASSTATNNNQNVFNQNQYSSALDAAHSSLSSSVSNEIGNSQFYIDPNCKLKMLKS